MTVYDRRNSITCQKAMLAERRYNEFFINLLAWSTFVWLLAAAALEGPIAGTCPKVCSSIWSFFRHPVQQLILVSRFTESRHLCRGQ
jgi:hypothetical protein